MKVKIRPLKMGAWNVTFGRNSANISFEQVREVWSAYTENPGSSMARVTRETGMERKVVSACTHFLLEAGYIAKEQGSYGIRIVMPLWNSKRKEVENV
jgi:hypothetical protein